MSDRPGRLVLLGHPIRHSLSPLFQNAALRRARIPMVYEALDVPPAQLDDVVSGLITQRAAGNVTIPHKASIYEMTELRTAVAERVGAVNTFWVADGRLAGDNTDVAGFTALVRDTIGSVAKGARLALIGAGGAASAVLAAVEQWPGVRVRLFSRSAERRSALAARYADLVEEAGTVEQAVHDATLVINATPVGMTDDLHPVPLALLPRRAMVIDLVYRRAGTSWVNGARGRGHIAADGKVMLLAQGAASFEQWFGVRPDLHAMREALG